MRPQIYTYSYIMIIMSALLTMSACGSKTIYENQQKIKQPWAYNDKHTFGFDVQDTSTAYDLHLIVEHDADFGFENMYIHVTTLFPDGKKVENPLSLQLASAEGTWISDCSGELCEIDILLAARAYYKLKGKYTITIGQHSRNEHLEGIQSIKLKIIHAE
jgi:gliding motility-associated lipoprotein GldH